ncbi:MAG: hypothetical protein ABI614_26420, partial [Planctomycetota bacterium]
TACLVTCFSLYLAFLDQMEPKEIRELGEELERAANAKILPRILWEREQAKPRVRDRHYSTVHEFDFFAMETVAQFHLVIGNPPWVSRKPAPNVEAWLYSERNPYAKELGWNPNRKTQIEGLTESLFPSSEHACAFMWKAGLHLVPSGRVCQVMPSRVFLSNNSDRFQLAWLSRHKLDAVWLLADYRKFLFPTAKCPCFIGRHQPLPVGEGVGEFEFVSPKVELSDPRAASLPVQPEDQKTLSQPALIAAARERKAASLWKMHYWGTPRDMRLLERLLRWPRLSRIARRPPGDDDAEDDDLNTVDAEASAEAPPRTWYKGQGFRARSASTRNPFPVFWRYKDRYLSARASVSDLVLLREQTTEIGDQFRAEGLDRKRNPLIFHEPMLIVNKACTKFLFSDFDVLFQDDFQSICAPIDDKEELLFLTAYFSSPLAQYLLFHTTANIGIERDIARLNEMLRLPFPLPEDMPDPTKAKRIIHACAARMLKLQRELRDDRNLLRRDPLVNEARAELYEKVGDYFGLCEWERELIADTVETFRPSSTPASLDSDKLFTAKPSKPAHRAAYAETLVRTFRSWTRGEKSIWAQGHVAPASGLALLTLG